MKPNIEIEEQIDIAQESRSDSRFSGMTYEDGVIAALEWVIGASDKKPMEE